MNRASFQYRIDADDRICFVDDEWLAFAQQNAAAELEADAILGHSLWDFIAGMETRHLYGVVFDAVREQLIAKTIPFRCDSPTCRRYMELVVAPLADRGLAINSSLLREEIRPYVPILDVGVPRTDEFLSICSWCKQVLLPEQRWVDVELAVSRLDLFEGRPLPNLTHSICDQCDAKMEFGA